MLLNILIGLALALTIGGAILLSGSLRIPSRLRKAEELLQQGNINEASEIVKNILEKKPYYLPARFLRGDILKEQNQYLLAISEFNKVLQVPEYKKFVNELVIHERLAELYKLTQQWGKEIEEYRLILKLNPNDLTANHRIGHTYYKKKKYRETYDSLSKALAINPRLEDCYLPIGVSAFNLALYNDAEQYLLRATEIPSDSYIAFYYLGIIYKGKKDYENAVQMFEKSRLDSDLYLSSILKLGEIYFENDEITKTIETLESSLQSITSRDDDSISIRYLLAQCYELENKIAEAVHHYQKIEQDRPGYKNTRIKLDDYDIILKDKSLQMLFTSTLNELQSVLSEIIARLNFNIISKKTISKNECFYKAFNIKRINEPPVLIYFHRSTKEITEKDLQNFDTILSNEKCKNGIYITTSRFSTKAKSYKSSKMFELLDKSDLTEMLTKIKGQMPDRELK